MNFAFVTGQEEQALDFFQKKIALCTNDDERKALDSIIKALKEAISKKGSSEPIDHHAESGLALAGAAFKSSF
jgi:hypothetical protein